MMYDPQTATTQSGYPALPPAESGQPNNPAQSDQITSAKTSYILDNSATEAQRLTNQLNILWPDIAPRLVTILDGKAAEQAGASNNSLATHILRQHELGRRPVILDAGCGEGLHLHRIAALLQQRDLLSHCYLLGVDKDQGRIAVADDYALAVKKSYLNFAVHDLTKPLEECWLLRTHHHATNQQPLKLDFIYVNHVAMHLPAARRHLKELYDHLVPGGYIYLTDSVTYEGGEWGYDIAGRMTPIIEEFYRILMSPLRTINSQDAGQYTHQWLSEWGAEVVEFSPLRKEAGGRTPYGVAILRNFTDIIKTSREYFVEKARLVTAEFYDLLLADVYSKLSPDMVCPFTVFHTVIRKPTE